MDNELSYYPFFRVDIKFIIRCLIKVNIAVEINITNMQNISKLANKIGLYHQKYSVNPCFTAKMDCQYSSFSKNEEIK